MFKKKVLSPIVSATTAVHKHEGVLSKTTMAKVKRKNAKNLIKHTQN